jgi:CRP/FNR family cyclic AMP-dependent transcriptional regulator
MNWIELTGYLGAGMTFVTFYMKAMLPLRYMALCSNVAFIVYGGFSHLYPVLFLHLCLLPLNLVRLTELRSLISRVRKYEQGELSIESLLPFTTRRHFNAGGMLFRKGDMAQEMYYVLAGIVHIQEVNMDIGPGEIAGVIGVFSPDKERPWTAVYKTDGELLVLSTDMVMQVCHKNPQFSVFLAHLITKRAIADMSKKLASTRSHNA